MICFVWHFGVWFRYFMYELATDGHILEPFLAWLDIRTVGCYAIDD
jgi:hypothetical protein